MTGWTFDDAGFGAGARRIPWDNLVAVGIRTTADGPFDEDVFWQFLLEDGLIELPGSTFGGLETLTRRLPGFDSLKVVRAMGSCEERIFRVWHREESRDRPDEASLRRRFGRLVGRLGARANVDAVFFRLHADWSSTARRYHDVEHLADCLRELDREPESPSRDVIELALWYHDAVYEPGASDSEERSATRLVADAAELGLATAHARAAAALVRATAHGAHQEGGDLAALVADIDLSILGRDPLRFMEYEYGVEEELAAIPRIALRRGRGSFLARLLEAPIYRTASFRERFEDAARANIAALLESPRYRPYRWLRWLPL